MVEQALATLVPLAALATSTWSIVVQVLRRFYKLVASCVVGLVRTIVGDGTAGSRNAPSVLSVDIPGFLLETQFATKTMMFSSVEDRTILLEGYSFGIIGCLFLLRREFSNFWMQRVQIR